MIHVIDNYYAVPNNMGFTVVKHTGGTNKKTGKPVSIKIGYCGNLQEVCWLIMKSRTNTLSSEKDMELAEVIKIMKETREMIKKALVIED